MHMSTAPDLMPFKGLLAIVVSMLCLTCGGCPRLVTTRTIDLSHVAVVVSLMPLIASTDHTRYIQ